MSNALKTLTNGILKENPTFALVLGMCPTLATTTSAINGMSMGLATLFVLVCSNVVISLLKNLIPDKVRIPAFIPLIVVNCIVLGRAEAFAAKNSVGLSALDGIGMGLGFTLSLTVLGVIREFLGAGTAFGFQIYSSQFASLIFVLAPGAFIALAYMMAIVNKLQKK